MTGMLLSVVTLMGVAGCLSDRTDTTIYPEYREKLRGLWSPGETRAIPDTGVIHKWLVCGPFPNPPPQKGGLKRNPNRLGLDTDHLRLPGGEGSVRPVSGMMVTAPDGTSREWFEINRQPILRPVTRAIPLGRTSL